MVSIIFLVLGVMFILTGLGLRPLVKSFGTSFAVLGGIYILDAGLGWGLSWTPHLQLWIAGGALITFTIITAVWQLMVKFKEINKKAEKTETKE